MDELQISGKRYVSSRRAAKDHGYAPDYIGQLIRGGKVRGQKVGRAWYVEAESLDTYLSGEGVDVAAAPATVEIAEPEILQAPTEPIEIEATEEVQPAVEEIKEEEVAQVQPVLAQATDEPAPVVVKVQKEAPRREEAEPIVVKIRKEGGLRYVANESLLPEIAQKPMTSVMPRSPMVREQKEDESAILPAPRRSGWGRAVLAGFGVAVFVASAVIGSSMNAVLHVKEGQTASIGYSIQW